MAGHSTIYHQRVLFTHCRFDSARGLIRFGARIIVNVRIIRAIL